ncbi:hypothetical protein YH65_09905 [Sulfurovum lithotrophicum]|uniref:Uncharacterized protein n=1 Tax=Sulfurovum lithotrophicum TaxID=206403 RepID=A0A7U4M2I0_9BACT|nr:hypothetical protein [Sulfurovum lithotrophicum]AKF25660.1 hypothetical protein YH65_09905 [Sulfurovum lithotrophicum]
MFTITVEKECGCFQKSDFTNNISFDNKDDALIEAMDMVKHMNEEFCNKHNFRLEEDGQHFDIFVADTPKAHSGCCGGGHCG